MEFTNQPAVLDSGSGTIRAGIAGESAPQCVVMNYVGRPKHDRAMVGSLEGDTFVGELAAKHRGLMRLCHPMSHGVIENWADMELVWQHVFTHELRIASEEHPLLVTEPPLASHYQREMTAQILFETFNAPAVYFEIPAVLALYASGKISGLVLDVGDGLSHVVPVYQGFAINSAIFRSDLGGSAITDYMQLLLRKQGVKLVTSAEREIVREIKEQHCRLVPTIASPGAHTNLQATADARKDDVEYRLPDGFKVRLGPAPTRAPELLFRPHIVGSEEKASQQLLADSIARCDRDLRPTFYQNILLSGGTTLTRGFGERLLNELKRLTPPQTKIKIFAPPDRARTSWMGGSILAGLSTFRRLWVTAESWQESGRDALF